LDGLQAIRDFVQTSTGLYFGEARMHLLRNGVTSRLISSGLNNTDEYLNLVSSEGEELDRLISSITTQETSFMRIPGHFRVIKEVFIPSFLAQNGMIKRDYLHVWSAGCSTGEEAYSLAITLKTSGIPEGVKLSILATDIDENALNTARKGVYKKERLKHLSPAQLFTFFKKCGENSFEVKKELRDCVHFVKQNLISSPYLFDQDIVFCRNVTIYFKREIRIEVLRKIATTIRTGGYLMLGESEILPSSIQGFSPISYDGSIMYKKIPGGASVKRG